MSYPPPRRPEGKPDPRSTPPEKKKPVELLGDARHMLQRATVKPFHDPNGSHAALLEMLDERMSDLPTMRIILLRLADAIHHEWNSVAGIRNQYAHYDHPMGLQENAAYDLARHLYGLPIQPPPAPRV